MKIEEIKEFLRFKPGYIKKGSGFLALHLEADIKKCKKALREIRKELSYPKIKTIDENLVLRSKWFNGKDWCESYRNMDTDPEPLTKEDWKEILSELPSLTPIHINHNSETNNKTLIVWTSDKHIGSSIPSEALYDRKYDEHIFHKRMASIYNEVISAFKLHGRFDKVILADLGDSLDGYNGFTTRGGHKLPQNLNNKEAARVHFFTHKWFYDKIITNDIANKITILNVCNDNHSGDFGYHANFALQQYGELAWPNVEFINQEKFLDHIIIYNRAFIITHGKDKTNRKRGLPLQLNAEVESFIMDYVIDRKIGNCDIHVRKGDIHLNDLDMTRKKLSYWNIGSVFGASDWIMTNFSDTLPSCVFEIVEEGHNNLDSKVIWLD